MVQVVHVLKDGRALRKWLPGGNYLTVADRLLDEVAEDKEPLYRRHYLVLIAQSTALEAILNDEILLRCVDVFGPEHYRSMVDPLLQCSLRNKLTLLPPMITGNRFILNKDSETVREIFSLVSLRNKIVHSIVDFDILEEAEHKNHSIPDPKKQHPARTLDISQLRRFAQALRALYDGFVHVHPPKFTECGILLKNPEYERWQRLHLEHQDK